MSMKSAVEAAWRFLCAVGLVLRGRYRSQAEIEQEIEWDRLWAESVATGKGLAALSEALRRLQFTTFVSIDESFQCLGRQCGKTQFYADQALKRGKVSITVSVTIDGKTETRQQTISPNHKDTWIAKLAGYMAACAVLDPEGEPPC